MARRNNKREQQLREFGYWLKDKRQREGYASQKEFAGLLDITDVQLNRIENGESGISARTLSVAIDLLHLDPLDAYKRAGLLPEFTINKIEDALDVTSFFDRKGVSDADRAKIRPLLESADRMIELLRARGATTPTFELIDSEIAEAKEPHAKIDHEPH